MIPDKVELLLIKHPNFLWGENYDTNKKIFIITGEDRVWFKSELGVIDPSSSFISYYSVVAIPPVGNGPELYTLEQIVEYENDGEEPKEIGSGYLRISSQEGGGGLIYNVNTDAVFDVEWGQEEDMIEGRLQPKYQSFCDFLLKYYT